MDNQNNASGQQVSTINIQVPTAANIASRRPLIPLSFALAIICFFFTFCDFKCQGHKFASVTGINLVTGTELKDRDPFSGREKNGKEIPSSIWAIFALCAGVVGIGIYLLKDNREATIGTGAGIIGFGSLIILQFVIKGAIEKEGKGLVDADFGVAYWIALIAMGVAGVISYLRINQTKKFVNPSASIQVTETIVQQTIQPNIQSANNSAFDITDIVQKNKKLLVGFIGSWYNWLWYISNIYKT